MGEQFTFDVRFYRLSEAIAPYFTALYSFDFDCEEGVFAEDYLHPEWAAMRFTDGGQPPSACVVPAVMADCPDFVASGPTSRAIRFKVRKSRIFGLGLLPAGWARFVEAPASQLANQIVDGASSPLAAFAPLLEEMRNAGANHDEVAARMNAFLLDLHASSPNVPERVLACQTALSDPDLADVDELSERIGASRRTLERLCLQYFGFPPKTMLRRQRFLRSLGRYMLESHDSWSSALDRQYFDQAHFVRDFRSFMGMTPSEYAAMPHPILDRIMAQRMVDQGTATNANLPTVLRYADEARRPD